VARYPQRPVPPPLETNATPVVLIGIAVWATAGVVLLLARHHVPTWWLWTCLAGLLIGGVILAYETWRRHRRTATPEPDPDPTNHPDPVH
jgi:predicted membrane metal-binding protein